MVNQIVLVFFSSFQPTTRRLYKRRKNVRNSCRCAQPEKLKRKLHRVLRGLASLFRNNLILRAFPWFQPRINQVSGPFERKRHMEGHNESEPSLARGKEKGQGEFEYPLRLCMRLYVRDKIALVAALSLGNERKNKRRQIG